MEEHHGSINLVQKLETWFLKFDMQELYPSIAADLLDWELKYACTIVNIPEDDQENIKLIKEALLMNSRKSWVNKSATKNWRHHGKPERGWNIENNRTLPPKQNKKDHPSTVVST